MLLARSLGTDLQMEKADRMDSADDLDATSLHRRYLKEIFRYVSRRVPRQEAEDITMQVLGAALEALPRFRGDCPPHVWILGIAHRKVIDALRRRNSRRETLASELADPATGTDPLAETMASMVEEPQAAVERAEARRVIRQLVDRLSNDQREALLLQYVEGLAVAEIAVIMGRSTAAIDSLLQRARATLYRLGRPYFLDNGEESYR
jgi:RNA polymerase sigma-70 factor (ECF subfamily)